MGGISLFLILMTLGFGFYSESSGANNATSHPTLASQIDELVREAHQLKAFHGNIEVRLGDEILYKKSLGIANVAFEVENTERSRFMVASISKQFTAAIVLKLHEQGVINIDNPYSDYVPLNHANPSNLENWNDFTIRELLSHTAGVMRDVTFSDNYNIETYASSVATVFYNMVESQNIFTRENDGKAHYSNFGYFMLAHMVERITGMFFHDVLYAEIFHPLGMESTGQYHRMLAIPLLADGYQQIDGIVGLRKRCCADASAFIGSHSLYSDVADMMLWLEEFTSSSPVVLSKESYALMSRPVAELITEKVDYGFGLKVDQVDGYERIWHDGFEYGYISVASSIPEIDLKIVILGNRHTSAVNLGDLYNLSLNDSISELVIQSLKTSK